MNSTRRPLLRFSLLVLLIALTSISIYGQSRGALRGLITDELGAAIVGASVTLTDATGAQKKTTTNAEGVYSFPALAPGKYSISAVAPGFAVSANKEVEVNNQRQTLD